MGEQDRREDAPAPGNWRVTARPYAPVAAPAGAPPAAPSLGPQAAPASPPAAAPARSGGHPLIASLICAGVLLLWLVGRDRINPTSGVGPAYYIGLVIGGAAFAAILWAIAYAITIRKASKGWKLGRSPLWPFSAGSSP